MIDVLLVFHVGAAILGFVLSGILCVGVLRQQAYEDLSRNFWRWERVAQWITIILGVSGTTLYLMGQRPTDTLHLMYGALAILAIILLGAFGQDKDPRDVLQGWKVNPKWVLFGINVFLWAMYGRGFTTGFFGF